MIFNYNGVKVYYCIKGDRKGFPTLLLHGWGCSGDIFSFLVEQFPSRQFILVDLPPFGKSSQPLDWTIFTYASMLTALCGHLNFSSVDVLGHSFGGRLAILLSSFQKPLIRSCVLVSSAGLKPKRKLKYYYKVYKFKILRKFHKFLDNSGSEDYVKLSPEMKKVFVNIVNTHLDEYAKLITCKTLIVFGLSDKETPIYMAKRLNKSIKKSKLVLLPDAGHYCFFDKKLLFLRFLSDFWGAEDKL